MAVTKKLSIVIMDSNRIPDVNHVIVKHSDSSSQSSSHVLFDVEPVTLTDIAEDLTFFRMSAEDEKTLDENIKKLIKELNELDTDYSIRNMETNNFYTTIDSVGAIYITLDKMDTIPKGTYAQIDELKNIKTEFGYCKGYKPPFRPLEGASIKDMEVNQENIYLFCTPAEDMPKLIDFLTERIMAINPKLEIDTKIFI